MKEAKIMKKNIVQKLFILFAAIGLFFTADFLIPSQEASAVVCEVSFFPCGKVYKKSGLTWSPGAKQDTVGSCVWPNQK